MNAQVGPVPAAGQEHVLGIDRFGESAPAPDVARELGLTPQAVCARVRALLQSKPSM
jgi:transketolase